MTTGYWEFREGSSSKFWQCSLEPVTKLYLTEWGRIGRSANAMKGGLSEGEARKKVREKEAKGYVRVGGVVETAGTRAGAATMARAQTEKQSAEQALTGVGQRKIRA